MEVQLTENKHYKLKADRQVATDLAVKRMSNPKTSVRKPGTKPIYTTESALPRERKGG